MEAAATAITAIEMTTAETRIFSTSSIIIVVVDRIAIQACN